MQAMSGKAAYISGGTSGINLAIAKGFAQRGAAVLVFGRDPKKAESAANEIRSETGGRALGLSADVRDFAAIAAAFASARAEIGAPSYVIAGAAGNFPAPAVGISANGFKTVVDIDLLGTYNVFRAAYDVIVKPGASMIAISAPQGLHPRPLQAHVCAAKAGINMLVRCLAMEWGAAGIRVNAISPGPIEGTEGVQRLAPTDEAKQKWASMIALRRLGKGSEIANVAAFLCSSEASYITGTILDSDGGSQLGDSSGDYLTAPARR
jgi:NAD(P)-dependent dehydrogenase (short-subunit alcohol dehydrogenase family)